MKIVPWAAQEICAYPVNTFIVKIKFNQSTIKFVRQHWEPRPIYHQSVREYPPHILLNVPWGELLRPATQVEQLVHMEEGTQFLLLRRDVKATVESNSTDFQYMLDESSYPTGRHHITTEGFKYTGRILGWQAC